MVPLAQAPPGPQALLAWQTPLTHTWPVAHGIAGSHCGQPVALHA